ncbi:MAG: hypothetical protein HYT66_00545, partial [Candidatus Yanofskybacteria bacterium]|nr:hypothetical protein [Candidatus Yanofskybacteria bacterium]
EKKFRVEDAVNATRAALEEGIVAGGGVAFLDVLRNKNQETHKLAGKKLAGGDKELLDSTIVMDDFTKGSMIITSILSLPIRAIAENSGENPDRVVKEVLKRDIGFGYNASTGQYVNMFEAGIIDPLKVVKTALTNAVSVASTILMTEVVITDMPEEKSSPGAGMPPMVGDY